MLVSECAIVMMMSRKSTAMDNAPKNALLTRSLKGSNWRKSKNANLQYACIFTIAFFALALLLPGPLAFVTPAPLAAFALVLGVAVLVVGAIAKNCDYLS